MKRFVSGVLVFLTVLVFAGSAFAEDRVVVMWMCDLKGDTTLDKVKSDNGKWVRFVNEAGAGDIRSFVSTTIIGSNDGDFIYLDSYPDLDAWTAAQKALESDEGQAIEAALEGDAECSSSSLLNAEESG
jgi:hypothetical protein